MKILTNPFVVLIGSILVTLCLCGFIGMELTKVGVPGFIIGILNFYLGITLPDKIMKWIYKEELEAIASERQKED